MAAGIEAEHPLADPTQSALKLVRLNRQQAKTLSIKDKVFYVSWSYLQFV
jgi:hypothetical protein